jgi:hypothetical protein
MRRSFLLGGILGLLVLACGGRTQNSEPAGCRTDIPLAPCLDACGHRVVEPLCVDGAWTCPSVAGTCLAPVDAGGCQQPPPKLLCTVGCGGDTAPPACVDGTWQCPPAPPCAPVLDADVPDDGSIVDAGAHDAIARDAVASDGGMFFCGPTTTCDSATTYCLVGEGGPPLPDGGTSIVYSCEPIPNACGAVATCACLRALPSADCACAEHDGEVKLECNVP